MRYNHPCEWFQYCRECGHITIEDYTESPRWEPEGEAWRARGWYCFACEGRVWWVKAALFGALFLKDVPTGYRLRGGNRINIERVVDWCLLCHDTVGVLDDRSDFQYMLCYECARILKDAIGDGLANVDQLPGLAVHTILLYLGL